MKEIYILIGPKGAGKSFIGKLMEESFGVKFFRVEDFWLDLKNKSNLKTEKEYFENIEEFVKNGNQILVKKISNILEKSDSLVIESLGVSPGFADFVNNLESFAKVEFIKITAKKDTCLKRVRSRDRSIHIPVSDEKVNEINSQILQNRFDDIKFDLEIENEDLPKKEIEKILEKIIRI